MKSVNHILTKREQQWLVNKMLLTITFKYRFEPSQDIWTGLWETAMHPFHYFLDSLTNPKYSTDPQMIDSENNC